MRVHFYEQLPRPLTACCCCACFALAFLILVARLGIFGTLGLGLLLGEISFFLRSRHLLRRLQRQKPLAERLPPPCGATDLFARCLRDIEECAAWSGSRGPGRTPAQFLEGWFLGTPLAQIRRDNVLELFAWAFFMKQVSELEESERRTIAGMIDEWERRFSWHFQDGYNAAAVPMRVNFDSLVVWHHPLLYYAGIYVLTAAVRLVLRLTGFTYHASRSGGISFFHKIRTPASGLPVVAGRAAAEPMEPPVVFLHGVGVGLAYYLPIIWRLSAGRECFVVELPEVSQAGIEDVLPPAAMAAAVAMMLQAHGRTSACFVAHSWGSVALSHVLRSRPNLVAKAVLIDPICFLMTQPDLPYNFLYCQPKKLFTLVVKHFLRWELFTANVLMRQSYWYHNVMWKEDIPADCIVVLASGDDLINPHAVRRYLEEHQCQQATEAPGSQLRLLWLEGFFHGKVLLSRLAQLQILELL